MSLRIKLPAKPSDSESQTSATQPQRRKSTKRRLTVDSDEEHTDHIPSSPPSSSHPQKPQPGQSRRRQTPADDADVAREYHEEEYVEVTETRVSTTSSNKKQPPHSGPPPQKKKRVVASDEDFDGDEPLGEVPRDMETDEDYEDDFGFEAKKSHHKGKGRLKATKGGAGNKSGKGKAKGEVNDTETKEDGSAASSTLKRPRANTKYSEDTNVDVVGDSPPSQQQQQPTTLVTSPTTKEPSPAPPPPKKRKLPTIKKNKVVGSGPATPTTSQANAPNKSAPHPPGKAGAESTSAGPLAHMVQRKAALQGNTDVDLRNANVYAELFKGVRSFFWDCAVVLTLDLVVIVGRCASSWN
ncbi:hypothetical protein BDN72DRAFT_235922 [Pluteus cervinus]|uniref:Uncharacterized protein n=1 Tax=Pluteus cervinus TaxID=181527 RepID=A0ACD3BFT9_9AGAR|nr:hypothetical protein BDN72DRAFT_235922 [Pluteus cervinus]